LQVFASLCILPGKKKVKKKFDVVSVLWLCKGMRNNTTTYHETLHTLVQDVQENYLDLNGATSEEFANHFWQPVGYNETARESFKLDSLKGKGTRRYLQVIIYRMESGRYELVCYS
jgi:hypothetical protein